jgi:hypothetical protein
MANAARRRNLDERQRVTRELDEIEIKLVKAKRLLGSSRLF